MARTRIIYQNEGVYIGPAPSTGYHFYGQVPDVPGDPNDEWDSDNINLVQSLLRVQSFTYNINTNRNTIRSLGNKNILYSRTTNPGNIDISFTYLGWGVLNEVRMGLNVNFPNISSPNFQEAIYPNNSGVCLISGYISNSLKRLTTNPMEWAYEKTEPRNIFLVQNEIGKDLNNDVYNRIHPNQENLYVVGFSNCYMTSYQARAAVGEFPTVDVAYVSDNMVTYQGGENLQLPALLPDRTQSPLHFNIPSAFVGPEQISVVRPGNISMDITAYQEAAAIEAFHGTGVPSSPYSTVQNLGSSFTDIKLQNYTVSFDLNRDPLNDIQSKLPYDRQINFPVTVSLDFSAIVGDPETGSLLDILDNNDDYDIHITLNSGVGVTMARYDLLKAKLLSYDYDGKIGDNKTLTAKFETNIDNNRFYQGFFISGILGARWPGTDGTSNESNYLLENGRYSTYV